MYPVQYSQNFIPFSPPQSPVFFNPKSDSPQPFLADSPSSPISFFSPLDYMQSNLGQMSSEQIGYFLKKNFALILQEADEEQFKHLLTCPQFCRALDRLFCIEKEPFFFFIEKFPQIKLLDNCKGFNHSLNKVLHFGSSKLRHYLWHPTVTQFLNQLTAKELLNIYKNFHGFWWTFPEKSGDHLIKLFKIMSGKSPTKEDFKKSFELAFFKINLETQKELLSHIDFAEKIHTLFHEDPHRLLNSLPLDLLENSNTTSSPIFSFLTPELQVRAIHNWIFEKCSGFEREKTDYDKIQSLSLVESDQIPHLITQRPDLYPTSCDPIQFKGCSFITIQALHRALPEAVGQIFSATPQHPTGSRYLERLKFLGRRALKKIDLRVVQQDEIRRLPVGEFMGLCIQIPALMDSFLQEATIHSMIAKRVETLFERQFFHHKERIKNFLDALP